jgi:hypothetical protein
MFSIVLNTHMNVVLLAFWFKAKFSQHLVKECNLKPTLAWQLLLSSWLTSWGKKGVGFAWF